MDQTKTVRCSPDTQAAVAELAAEAKVPQRVVVDQAVAEGLDAVRRRLVPARRKGRRMMAPGAKAREGGEPRCLIQRST